MDAIMARRLRNRLTPRTVSAITKPGRYADGGGLYLQVDESGARRWIFLYRFRGKRPEMGLGGHPVVSLAEAREKAFALEKTVRSGINPLAEKRSAQRHKANEVTFAQVIEMALPTLTASSRNETHKHQWQSTLSNVYIPHLRSLPITDINPADVAKDLLPLWNTRPTTAQRLRGRIEKVLDFAEGKQLRSGDNPARLSPTLSALLGGAPRSITKHHKALPFAKLPEFIGQLQSRPGTSSQAYIFLILTAARLTEVLRATWSEIDWEKRTWTVAAERYKTKKDHIVPLTEWTLSILAERKQQQSQLGITTDLIFPNDKGTRLSPNVFAALHQRMGVSGFTTHGFRSTFRDWAGDIAEVPREIAELALGHIISNRVEAAYRRTTSLEKRRELMLKWEMFCRSE